MNTPQIIGITGHMRAGKDTVAWVLGKVAGYRRVGFADAVKEMALAIDPYVILRSNGIAEMPLRLSEVVQVQGWETAKGVPEVRRLLQRLGTEAGREVLGNGVWVEALQRRLFRGWGQPLGGPYAVADVRFKNEAYWIKGVGQLWAVVRPGYDGDGHASETAIPELVKMAEVVIQNDGSLEELEQRVKEALGR